MDVGLGVAIGYLTEDGSSFRAIESSKGKTIARVFINPDDDVLRLVFTDGSVLKLWDDGQSCCESRYMRTDDELPYFTGSSLQSVEIKDGPSEEVSGWGEVHEIQFLVVTTSKGAFTVANHNEHNGYYGGFWLKARLEATT